MTWQTRALACIAPTGTSGDEEFMVLLCLFSHFLLFDPAEVVALRFSNPGILHCATYLVSVHFMWLIFSTSCPQFSYSCRASISKDIQSLKMNSCKMESHLQDLELPLWQDSHLQKQGKVWGERTLRQTPTCSHGDSASKIIHLPSLWNIIHFVRLPSVAQRQVMIQEFLEMMSPNPNHLSFHVILSTVVNMS